MNIVHMAFTKHPNVSMLTFLVYSQLSHSQFSIISHSTKYIACSVSYMMCIYTIHTFVCIQYYAIRYGMGDGGDRFTLASNLQIGARSVYTVQHYTYIVYNTLYCNDKNTNNVMNQNKSIAVPYRTVYSASRGGKSDIIHNIQHTHTHRERAREGEWYFIPSTKTHTIIRTWAYAYAHTHSRTHARTHAHRSKFMNLLVLLYHFQLMGESVKTRK